MVVKVDFRFAVRHRPVRRAVFFRLDLNPRQTLRPDETDADPAHHLRVALPVRQRICSVRHDHGAELVPRPVQLRTIDLRNHRERPTAAAGPLPGRVERFEFKVVITVLQRVEPQLFPGLQSRLADRFAVEVQNAADNSLRPVRTERETDRLPRRINRRIPVRNRLHPGRGRSAPGGEQPAAQQIISKFQHRSFLQFIGSR